MLKKTAGSYAAIAVSLRLTKAILRFMLTFDMRWFGTRIWSKHRLKCTGLVAGARSAISLRNVVTANVSIVKRKCVLIITQTS